MRIPRRLVEEIFTHARRDAPSETCGWLAGRNDEVERIYPVANAAQSPQTGFVMEPQAQISSMRAIRQAGMEIVGTYHSHPASPPIPSERDHRLALYPDIVHLIVSLKSQPGLRLWRITSEETRELELRQRVS